MSQNRIYLDYASTTPLDREVEKEMQKTQRQSWGNPSSLHQEGERAKKILEESRARVARILHCRSSEVFFTGSGTEALNIAILGICREDAPLGRGKEGDHVICSVIEHSAVLEPIKELVKNKKIEVSFIYPNSEGVINPESVKKEIKNNTTLVMVGHSNNEIGTIQPIRKISNLKSQISKFVLLVDASQSICYEDISIERLGADILVLDGIKMYGPRGAGILVIKHGAEVRPIMFGGGQERGLRSGTENVPAAVGLAKALEIAVTKREKESKRLIILRDYAIEKILKEIPGSSLNGSLENRLPNNINICFPGQDSEFLVIKLDTLGFAVSAASACHSLSESNNSYVIEALSKPECASSSLRITLGRETKQSDLDKLVSVLKNIIK